MKRFGDSADALQGPAKQRSQIRQHVGAIESHALKSSLVRAWQNPGFVGDPRRIWAERDEITPRFKDAQFLLGLLRNDIAKDTSLFLLKIFAARAQFVENPPGNERCRRKLGRGMLELLPGGATVVLENADVFEAPIALQILNALRDQKQKLADLEVAGVPQMTIVARILHQHLMSADRTHAIVNAVSPA